MHQAMKAACRKLGDIDDEESLTDKSEGCIDPKGNEITQLWPRNPEEDKTSPY